MKFFVVSLSAFLIAAGMAAAAAAEVARDAAPDIVEIFPRMEADIQKRGYGCGVFSDDVGICNFHVRPTHFLSPDYCLFCIANWTSMKLTPLPVYQRRYQELWRWSRDSTVQRCLRRICQRVSNLRPDTTFAATELTNNL